MYKLIWYKKDRIRRIIRRTYMKAIIELNGMVCEKKECEGDTQEEIILLLYEVQDLDCLVRMGPMFGEDVSELESFMDKFYNGELTCEDIKKMNIELSIGTIKCIAFED